jgi:hypothetical protein
MRKILLSMLFCAALAGGAGAESQLLQAEPPATAQSNEKPASIGSADAGLEQNQEKPEAKNKDSAATMGAIKRRPSAGRAKSTAPHRPTLTRQTGTGTYPSTAANATDSRQMATANSQARASDVSTKTMKHSGVPVSSPKLALNGQQFKNSRDPGARLASSGGPATQARGTAGISGSEMKRKP